MICKKLYGLFILLVIAMNIRAQHAVFIQSGKVSFERKINMYSILPTFLKDTRPVSNEQIAAFMQQYKSSSPQFVTDGFDLFFDTGKTVYNPDPAGDQNPQASVIPLPVTNSIVSDIVEKKVWIKKQIYDKSFFVVDSISSIRWKLTDEIREIAGFQCRRANALLFDSVYVVAFYTEEIPTKGGPGIFNGLPGMILGVALPHQHITIFATKVVAMEPSKEIEKTARNLNVGNGVNNNDFNAEVAQLLSRLMAPSGWVKIALNL